MTTASERMLELSPLEDQVLGFNPVTGSSAREHFLAITTGGDGLPYAIPVLSEIEVDAAPIEIEVVLDADPDVELC
tara:strand:- start:25360 stop:25587 length:228 start_codon:yes stop_codon:yes gene_type:complete